MAKEVYADQIAEYFTKTLESTFLLKEITKKETREGSFMISCFRILSEFFGAPSGKNLWKRVMKP